MPSARPDPRDRAVSALLSAGLVALLGWLLVIGLAVRMPTVGESPLAVFEVAPPSPPPPVRIVPERTRNRRPEGEAAPPNLRSRATPVVAPLPIILIPTPSPVIAAPVAGPGSDPSQGAAAVPGPGTGAGGVGNGTGSGGNGDGDGGGWEDETPPRRIRGRLRDSDYPEAAAEAGASGVVSVRYAVEVNGRVSGCRVTRSSGNAALDATTCRLITERYRYRPSLDADGQPVRVTIVVDHEWSLQAVPAEPTG
ncbi:energy transducer TonB [uncultured Sphingomonas sp.]|uniref:energy transducer TonB n=1 Tax=uncultured Sphingomonas sp. TaxID=158754 RepID=UPI0035CA0B4A